MIARGYLLNYGLFHENNKAKHSDYHIEGGEFETKCRLLRIRFVPNRISPSCTPTAEKTNKL